MKPEIPPVEDRSIYNYVKQHIDDDGFFPLDKLPDNCYSPMLPCELGTIDAYITLLQDEEPPEHLADEVCRRLDEYVKNPDKKHEDELLEIINNMPCSIYCDAMLDKLSHEIVFPPVLLQTALKWLRTAEKREPVKFAIVIIGLFNLDNVMKTVDFHVKNDLMMLARCEEFTYFVIMALQMSNQNIDQELWEILTHTRGWGRVHALGCADFSTPTRQDYLLRHGNELSVLYPPVALVIVREGHLLDALRQEQIDDELCLAAQDTVNNLLIFLNSFEQDDDFDGPSLPSYHIRELIEELLRHSATRNNTIPEILGLVSLRAGLLDLVNGECWDVLSANECHLLISRTESLIFHKDWVPEIKKSLVGDNGSINYTVVALAQALDIDISVTLFNLLQSAPENTELYKFLLFTGNEGFYRRVLAFASRHLQEYCNMEDALPGILLSLYERPGTGTEFIIAGLASIYDMPRSYALNALEKWGPKEITPAIRSALFKARAFAQDPFLQLRINALLNGQVFKIDPDDIPELEPHSVE